MGLEGPLDDGFSWRKYGQKDILGAKHPRYLYLGHMKLIYYICFLPQHQIVLTCVVLQRLLQMHSSECSRLFGNKASATLR